MFLSHLWLFYCCGGSAGRGWEGEETFIMHAKSVMLTEDDGENCWASLGWLRLTYGEIWMWTPVPGISHAWVRRSVGEGGICPLPAVIPHPGTFRNNLAGSSVSPEWRNVHQEDRDQQQVSAQPSRCILLMSCQLSSPLIFNLLCP